MSLERAVNNLNLHLDRGKGLSSGNGSYRSCPCFSRIFFHIYLPSLIRSFRFSIQPFLRGASQKDRFWHSSTRAVALAAGPIC